MAEPITRREALRRIALTSAGLALGIPIGRDPARSASFRRPNIVVILTDDQRWDAMSCAGHPLLRTPNIDRIAAEGVRFANAFVTTSLCSPSRASFLTGTYAHTHGVLTNETRDHAPELRSFPSILRANGYETAYVGKWHMKPSGEPRPGFDYWLSFAGQGQYADPALNENGRELQAAGYITDVLTDYAVRWLRRRRYRPFCLYLAHKAPHQPFAPAPRHAGLYCDAKLKEPPSFDDTFASKPQWMRTTLMRGARRDQRIVNYRAPVPPSVPPGRWGSRNQDYLQYYRTLAAVDDSVGQVLEALERLGVADSTVVVFASDNGFFHGEHRWSDKRLMYGESIRIPLLVRYPRLFPAGRVAREMILNIDLAPTLLDIAKVPVPQYMQGRSFKPLVTGAPYRARTSFLYEYFEEDWLPGIPTMLGVRTTRWKYITYPELEDLDELYDLAHDPHEMRNLALDRAHAGTLAAMKQELERLKRETGYREPAPPPPVDKPGRLVLHYRFGGQELTTAADLSGHRNHGRLHGVRRMGWRRDEALRLRGWQWVEVPKSPSLDLGGTPFAIEAWVRAFGDGVVSACGGEQRGFSLYIAEGKPCFALRPSGRLQVISGRERVTGRWTHLAAVLTGDYRMRLYADGTEVANRRVKSFIASDPHEEMVLGADCRTPVGEYEPPFALTGVLREFRMYDGEISPGEIRQRAAGIYGPPGGP